MLLLQTLAGACVKLQKTNAVLGAAESVPLQEGSPELAVLQVNTPKALSLLLLTFQATMA